MINLVTANAGGKDGKASSVDPKTTSSSQMVGGRLVSVAGPGGTTAYISPLDVGTIYGYELMEQGKVVCSAGRLRIYVCYFSTKKIMKIVIVILEPNLRKNSCYGAKRQNLNVSRSSLPLKA